MSTLNWQILQKEMDYIEGTVKNLDEIIHETKNFAFLTWGGSLFLLTRDLNSTDFRVDWWMYAMTSLITILFWMMDFRWRKHLLRCGKRKEIISRLVNSEDISAIDSKEGWAKVGFPLYDPIGSFYTQIKIFTIKI